MEPIRGGISGLSLDGDRLDVVGEVEIRMGLPTRETEVGAVDVLGFTEGVGVPGMYFELSDSASRDHEKLGNVTNGTLTVEMKNGKVFSLANCWSKNPDGGVLNSQTGRIRYEFDGIKMIPIL